MIHLKLDPKFKKRFPDLDIESLSLVYSLIFDSIYKCKKKRNYKIYIKMTSGVFSYYTWQQGTNVRINISDIIFNIDTFNSTLLHEFRHFCQDKIFKIPITKKNYNETTTESYLMSPVEIDADNFERLSYPKTLKLYNKIVKIKQEFRQLFNYNGTGV